MKTRRIKETRILKEQSHVRKEKMDPKEQEVVSTEAALKDNQALECCYVVQGYQPFQY